MSIEDNKHYLLTESERQRLTRYLLEGERLRQALAANNQIVNDLVEQIMEGQGVSGQTHILNLQTMEIAPREESHA